MPNKPEIYRNIPYRPPREVYSGGNTMELGKRYLRTYMWKQRWLLVTAALLFLIAANTGYVLTFATRHMVNEILRLSPNNVAAVAPETPADFRAVETESVLSAGDPPMAGGTLSAAMSADARYERGSHRDVWHLAAIVIFTVFVLNMCSRISSRLQMRLSINSCAELRRDLHRKILRLDYLNIGQQTPGRLMSNILTDVTSMQAHFVSAITNFVGETAIILAGIGLILWLDWRLALVAIILLPLHAWLYHSLRQPMKQANREVRHTSSCLWQYSTQRLNGIKTIMAYTQEVREFRYFFRLGAAYLRDAILQQKYVAIINSNAQFLSGLATALVYVVGTWFVMHNEMSVGDMIMFYGVVTQLFAHILVLTALNDQASQVSVVLNRIYGVLDTPVLVQDKPDCKPIVEPVNGEIVFDDVTFSYPDSERPAVHDIDIAVVPGEWLCIMGPSGAGKSTFVNLLTRLADPRSGHITIDGQPLDKIEIASLRRNMVLVPQEPQIFSGSVADNITYGRHDVSPRLIMDAAMAADLHETVMNLPGKYETLLGENGVSLSGGQRQRLSLARALITDPRILILDDCTSALDANTERKIQETLSRTLAGRTAIIVSQRVSMAQRCDRIMVLRDGAVSELGNHEELLANDKFYAQLHRRQMMVEDQIEAVENEDSEQTRNPAPDPESPATDSASDSGDDTNTDDAQAPGDSRI